MNNPFVKRIKRDNAGPGGWWWGLVGYEDYKNIRLFAIIPLNFLWAFGRWLWPYIAYRWSLWFNEHPLPFWKSVGVLTKVLKPVFHNSDGNDDFGVISIQHSAVDTLHIQAMENIRAFDRELQAQAKDFIFELSVGIIPADTPFVFDRSRLVLPFPGAAPFSKTTKETPP